MSLIRAAAPRWRWASATAADEHATAGVLRIAFAPYARAMGYALEPDAFDWLGDAIEHDEVFVARRGSALAGVVAISRHADAWNVDYIAAAPRFQGEGLGGWMLARLDEAAREAAVRRLTLHTAKRMDALLRLYRRHGYRRVREGLPPHRRDANPRVYLEKRLD